MHEPVHTKYEAIKQLKQRLNRKKVLNVNVVEKESIRKENQGKGAMLSNSMRVDDSSMVLFNKELVKLLLLPQKDDKWMEMKINNAKKTQKINLFTGTS